MRRTLKRRYHAAAAALLLAGLHSPALAQDHPLLAGDQSQRWYAPAASDQVIYIGKDAQHPPTLTLDKRALRQGPVKLRLSTDARTLTVTSGQASFDVPLPEAMPVQLMMSADRNRPTLELDGRRLEARLGDWVRLAVLEPERTVTLRFNEAEYANLAWDGPRAAAARPAVRPEPTASFEADAPAVEPDRPAPAAAAPRLEIQPQEEPAAPAPPTASPHPAQTQPVEVALAPEASDDAQQLSPAHGAMVEDEPVVQQAAPIVEADPAGIVYPTPRPIGRLLEPENYPDLYFTAGLEARSAYFYRGIAQENQDLILQPSFDAFFRIHEDPHAELLQHVTLNVGFRSSHHWGPTGDDMDDDKWYEFDWHGGVIFGFLDRWELGIWNDNRVAINNGRGNIPTALSADVHQVELKLAYDDADPAFDWQLSPYLLTAFEYTGPFTGSDDFQSDFGNDRADTTDTEPGIYLELGVEPSFHLFELGPKRPVQLRVPARVGLSLSDYYEDQTERDETFGFAEVGLDLAMPVFEIPLAAPTQQIDGTLVTGVRFLFLGDHTENLSALHGAGGDDFETIFHVGLHLAF